MKNRIAARYKYEILRLIDESIAAFHESRFFDAIETASKAQRIFQRAEDVDLFDRLRSARDNRKYVKYVKSLKDSARRSTVEILRDEAIMLIRFESENFIHYYGSSSPLMSTFLRVNLADG